LKATQLGVVTVLTTAIIITAVTMMLNCVFSAYFEHVQNDMCQLGPWLALIGLVSAISWYLYHLTVMYTIVITYGLL